MDGLQATRQIIQDRELSEVKVLVLTTFDEDELVVRQSDPVPWDIC